MCSSPVLTLIQTRCNIFWRLMTDEIYLMISTIFHWYILPANEKVFFILKYAHIASFYESFWYHTMSGGRNCSKLSNVMRKTRPVVHFHICIESCNRWSFWHLCQGLGCIQYVQYLISQWLFLYLYHCRSKGSMSINDKCERTWMWSRPNQCTIPAFV